MFEISKKLKDRYFRIAGIPLSAISVILLYNLLTTQGEIKWSMADFIFLLFVAAGLWFSNVKIQYILRATLYSIKKISFRLLARYTITFILSYIISFILFTFWNYLLHNSIYETKTIIELQLISVLISLQVSSIYEIAYLNKERQSDIVKIERTEKSKIQAQLDSLKNQVDPHFIFNSLNTLSYLISQNQESAKLFNDTLARVYRYILIKKEKDLVLLKEEIEFASNYFYLLKIRYQQGLKMRISIDDIISENYLLPPLSLQILIENAIKHNHFTERVPLNILVTVIKDQVTVTNNRNVKQFEIQSSQIGLKNLSERYVLITDKNITLKDTKDNFTGSAAIAKIITAMINTIIIEDEKTAADNLARLLKLTKEPVNIITVLESVEESIDWFIHHPPPDLVFMDIQLKDGNSFSIFEKVNISSPIVFITAYDTYLVNAFEQNSIEFLLKPVNEVSILHSIYKYKNLKQHFNHRYEKIASTMATKPKRTRIIVKKGIEHQSVLLEDVAYFFTEHKITFLVTKEEKKFMLDQNLKELEEELDPQRFYRANRKFIVNIDCIKSYKTFEKVKLSLDLRIAVNEEIIISQESAPSFKKWISEV